MIHWEEWILSLGLFRNHNLDTEFFLVQIRTRLCKIIYEKTKRNFFPCLSLFHDLVRQSAQEKIMTKEQQGFLMPKKTSSWEVGAWRDRGYTNGKGRCKGHWAVEWGTSLLINWAVLGSRRYYVGAGMAMAPINLEHPLMLWKVHFLYIGTQKKFNNPPVL